LCFPFVFVFSLGAVGTEILHTDHRYVKDFDGGGARTLCYLKRKLRKSQFGAGDKSANRQKALVEDKQIESISLLFC
jgi:hypothetical protein